MWRLNLAAQCEGRWVSSLGLCLTEDTVHAVRHCSLFHIHNKDIVSKTCHSCVIPVAVFNSHSRTVWKQITDWGWVSHREGSNYYSHDTTAHSLLVMDIKYIDIEYTNIHTKIYKYYRRIPKMSRPRKMWCSVYYSHKTKQGLCEHP